MNAMLTFAQVTAGPDDQGRLSVMETTVRGVGHILGSGREEFEDALVAHLRDQHPVMTDVHVVYGERDDKWLKIKTPKAA